MTLEEAIKLLKQYQGYDPMFPDGETLKHAFDLTDETVDTILLALDGMRIGKPLTIEELQGMEGRKVLLYRMKSTEPLEPGTVKQNGDVLGDAGMLAYHELYLETWVAFSYQAQEKPDFDKPLTLEQMREMDDNTDMCGLPSILEVTGVKCFGIVDRRDDDGICGVFAANGSWLKEKEYGKTWIAYAYPPAHIDRETWTAEWKDHYRSGIKVGSGFVCSSCDMWNGEQSDICPYCGRAMSEYGFSKLEKRLRGVR